MSSPASAPTTPRSEEGERGILSLLLDDERRCDDARLTIPKEYFYNPANRLLFTEILWMHENGRPIDRVTVAQHLFDRQLMDKIGGPAALSEFFGMVLTPTHYSYYRSMLKDQHLLRQTITVLSESLMRCYEPHEDVPAAVANICSTVVDSIKPDLSEGHKPFPTHVAEYLDVWQARMSGGVQTAIPTRWPSLNLCFGGLTPDMWLVPGYPSQGKSVLAQNLIEDTVRQGYHAIWYSYEMNRDQCLDRLMVAETGLEPGKVFFPQHHPVSKSDTRAIAEAVTRMSTMGIHLRMEPTWTIEQIDADVKSLCTRHKVGVVVIDHLQLVPTDREFGTRAEQVAYISRLIKRRISAANNVAVVVCSQLNDDGRPLDSRAPTQDAANILAIEKEGLRVSKNRNGERGSLLPLVLEGAKFSFVERPPFVPAARAIKDHEEWT